MAVHQRLSVRAACNRHAQLGTKQRTDLIGDEGGRDLVHAKDALRILSGERRQDRHAVR